VKRRMNTFFFVMLVLASSVSQAAAWGDLEHMMVGVIAYDRLTSAVREHVITLLKLHPQYALWVADVPEEEKARIAFLRASRWPDGDQGGNRPSGPTAAQNIGYADRFMHKYWHFVDLPFSPDNTALVDPPAPNARTQIALFRKTLASPVASSDLKSYDMVWLIHLVGDVHQPLHATSRFDRAHVAGDDGGNGVMVCSAPCQTPERLHAFWDHVLGVSTDPALAIERAKQLPVADSQLASIGDESVWIRESFEAAQTQVYVPPIGIGAGPFQVSDGYKTTAQTLAMQRLAIAGARLANLLNNALR
jgi:hypothetical protein